MGLHLLSDAVWAKVIKCPFFIRLKHVCLTLMASRFLAARQEAFIRLLCSIGRNIRDTCIWETAQVVDRGGRFDFDEVSATCATHADLPTN